MKCLSSLLAVTFSMAATAAPQPSMLRTSTSLSSIAARKLLARAVEISSTRGYHLCVAIDDPAGNLLAFDRQDSAAPGCAEASMAKARSAAINGADTEVFLNFARNHNPALGAIPGIVPAVAGVVLHHQGAAVGSIGIAGGPSDDEEQRFAAELRQQLESWLDQVTNR